MYWSLHRHKQTHRIFTQEPSESAFLLRMRATTGSWQPSSFSTTLACYLHTGY
eukprot:jgi/Psemu1/302185/fgenesh1_kg.60_\